MKLRDWVTIVDKNTNRGRVVPVHVLTVCGELEVQLNSFLTTALDGEWLASCPGRLDPRQTAPFLKYVIPFCYLQQKPKQNPTKQTNVPFIKQDMILPFTVIFRFKIVVHSKHTDEEIQVHTMWLKCCSV
jgi:hypothetical protein